LQVLLAELEAQAQADLTAQTDAILAAHQAQVDAVNSGTDRIVEAIAAQPAPIIVVPPVPVTPPETGNSTGTATGTNNADVVSELQKQREDAQRQSEATLKEPNRVRSELYRTQDMLYNSSQLRAV